MGHRWAVRPFLAAGAVLLAVGAPAAGAQVQAPPSITATKTVTGTFEEGEAVVYTIVLTNSGGVASADDPASDELVDVFPAGLDVVSANASQGTTAIGVDTGTGRPKVTWNGALVVGAVTITVNAEIQPGTEGDDLVNQADVHFDADGDGTNEATVQTDGDDVTPDEQATILQVAVIDPTVTIEQALVQPDPAENEPVRFTVEFSEPVSGLDGNDVVRTGTAGATNALVTGDVPGTTFTVIVTGATSPGTVIASIPADAAVDDDGNGNEASTSVDNQVTLNAIGTTTSTTASTASTSTLLGGSTTTTAAVAGTGSLPRTGSDEDGPLVAFLGYWLALGGVAAVGLAGWHRRRSAADQG